MTMEITLRNNLHRLSTLFTESAERSNSFIGARAVNDQKILGRIFDGNGFTVATYDRLVDWLSANWPPGLEWPTDIERPEPTVARSFFGTPPRKDKVPA